tara:strand:+ start:548 stop:682 length:135 start_codon:yes stop_codon:yes gene_type:complete
MPQGEGTYGSTVGRPSKKKKAKKKSASNSKVFLKKVDRNSGMNY